MGEYTTIPQLLWSASFIVVANYQLQTLGGVSLLENVTGDVSVSDNSNLVTLGLTSLATVGGKRKNFETLFHTLDQLDSTAAGEYKRPLFATYQTRPMTYS